MLQIVKQVDVAFVLRREYAFAWNFLLQTKN